MRAIFISDADCKAIIEKLELEKLRAQSRSNFFEMEVDHAQRTNDTRALVSAVHRLFHFELVRWLQDQGWKA